MVAIVTGAGLGLEQSSSWLLGARGQLGSAAMGRAAENVYVNGATGNLVVTHVDESLLGRGPDAVLNRTYNSLGGWDGDNNDGWRVGAYRKVDGLTGVRGQAGSTITRTDWDGSQTVYTWDGGVGAYVAKDGAGAHDTLTYSMNINRWTWTDGDTQIYESYDNANGGRIISRNLTADTYQTYTYTGSLITRINNSGGEYLKLEYVGNLLKYVEAYTNSPTATTTRVYYGYDASNRLTTVTVDLKPADNSNNDPGTRVPLTDKYVTTYTYHDASNRVKSITQSDGSVLSFEYDSSNRVREFSQAIAGQTARKTTLVYGNGTTTITDALGQVTTLTYDASGRLTGTTLPAPSVGSPAPLVTYTYNSDGDVASVTSAGNTVTYEYEDGNCVLERDSLGNTVARTFGEKNELLTETRYAKPDPDGAGGLPPLEPMTTRYVYDALNNLRFVVSAEGRVTEYGYDAYNQRTSSLVYTTITFNLDNYTPSQKIELSTISPWAENPAMDKSGFQRVETTYDVRGAVFLVNRSFAKLLPNGTFDATTEQTREHYIYGPNGELVSKIVQGTVGTANWTTETYLYDGMSRITSSSEHAASGATAPTTTIAYNDAARTTTVTLANGLVRTSTYDLAGNLVTVVESGASVATATTTYDYDLLGRLRMVSDDTGPKQYYLYDAAGRRIAEIDADGSTTEYRYDLAGRITSSTAWAVRMSDAQRALLIDAGKPATISLASVRPPSHADDRWNWRYYDLAGRIIRTIDGTGAVTVYGYDGASRLTDTTQFATRLDGGALTALKNASGGNLLTGAVNTPGYWSTNPGLLQQSGTVSIGGTPALQLNALTTGQVAAVGSWLHGVAVVQGDTITYTVQLLASSSTSTASVALRGSSTSSPFGANADSSIVVTGPGVAGTRSGAAWIISGLSQTAVTTVTITRKFTQPETAYAIVYADSFISGSTQNNSIYFANAAMARAGAPVLPGLPDISGDDRKARNFYDNDNHLVATLDAEGNLSEIVYDDAGRKIRTLDWSTAVDGNPASLRATGTLDQLLGNIATNPAHDAAKDVRNWYLYDARGLLVASIDGEGTLTRFHYTAAGYLDQKITGQKLDVASLTATPPTLAGLPAAGSAILTTISWTRNLYGQALTETRSLSGGTTTVTAYSYDSMRRLVRTTTQSGGSSPRTYGQRYDMQGHLTGELTPEGSQVLAGLSNPDEAAIKAVYDQYGITYAYDREGRLTSRTGPIPVSGAREKTLYFYNADDRLAFEVDALGQVIGYSYNAFGEVSDTITYGTALSAAVLGPLSGGRLTTTLKTMFDGLANAAIDRATHVEFNADGTIGLTRDALGKATTYSYSGFGEVRDVFAPLSGAATVQTRFSYDRRGLLTQKIVDAATGGKAITTSYGYDAFGRVLTLTDPNNNVTTSAWDRAGRLTRVTDALNHSVTNTYDARGNVVATTDALGNITRNVYDKANRKIFTIDALGDVTAYTYDADGRILTSRVQVARYANVASLPLEVPETTPIAQFGSTDLITTYTYDSNGRVATTKDALNKITTYAYNGRGDVVAVTDPLGGITRHVYDASGREVAVIDPLGGLTTKTYDSADQVKVTRTYYNPVANIGTLPLEVTAASLILPATNTLDQVVNYTYDLAGHVQSSTDALGNVTRYVYDAGGRKIATINALGEVTTTSYDSVGRVIATRSYATPIANVASLPLGLTETSLVLPAANTAADTFTRYFYDAAGNLAGVIQADGSVTERRYDAAGRVTSTTAYATRLTNTQISTLADASGRPTNVAFLRPASSTDDVWSWTIYDADGRVAQTVDALGNVIQYRYDAAGQLIGKAAFATRLSAVELTWLKTAPAGLAPNAVPNSQFAGTAGWTVGAGDPAGIVKPGSPYTLVTGGKDAIKIDFVATASGQITSIATDLYAVPVTGGRHYAVQIGAQGQGPVGVQNLVVWWYDASGDNLGSSSIGSLSGPQSSDTRISGFANAPAGAVSARFELYMATSGAGAGSFLVNRPIVSEVSPGQTVLPAFTPTPASSAGDDVTTYSYSASGKLLATKDALGNVTRYFYDAAGNLTGTVQADGAVTEQRYDAGGRVTSTTTYATRLTSTQIATLVDANGKPTTAAFLRPASSADDVWSWTIYDLDGRVAQTVDALGDVVQYRYDALDRVIGKTAFATRLSATELAWLRTAPQGLAPNLLANSQVTGTGNWVIGTNLGMINPGSPYTDTYQSKDFLKAGFTASAANQTTSLATEERAVPVNGGQTYAVQVGVEGQGVVGPQMLAIWWYDISGVGLGKTDVASVSGPQPYDTRLSGFATAPAGAVSARFELYVTSSGAGTGTFVVVRPEMSVASPGQTTMPAFTPTPASSAGDDVTTYTYGKDGNLVAVKDALGNITRYVYDATGRKIATIDAARAVSFDAYDATGNLILKRDYYTALRAADLPATTLEVTAATLQSFLSLAGVATTSASDHVSRFAYNALGQLRFAMDAAGHVTETIYDAVGNAVRTVAYDGQVAGTPPAIGAEAWFDAQVGPLESVTGTRITRTIYDAAGEPVYAIDATGQVTGFVYDTEGHLIRQIQYTREYSDPADPTAATMDTWAATYFDASKDRVSFAWYDRNGQLAYSQDALGAVTRYVYDSRGLVSSQTRYSGTFSYASTPTGVIATATQLATLDTAFNALTDDAARRTRFGYDAVGRLTSTIDPEGYETRLVLNALGQIVTSTDAYGTSEAVTTRFEYDALGRGTKQIQAFGTTDEVTTLSVYDALGRVTDQTVAWGTADAATTHWEYDELGQVLSVTQGYGATGAAATQYEYDSFGRVKSTTDAKLTKTANDYNRLDQVTARTVLMQGTGEDIVTRYTYDNFGNVASITDPRDNVSYNYYDKLDRVWLQFDGIAVTETGYSAFGEIHEVTRRFGTVTNTPTTTEFPAYAGDPRDAGTTFFYDKRGQLTSTVDAEQNSESYTLNAFGERETFTNKLGGVTGYAYDRRGLVVTETRTVTLDGSTTATIVNKFEYDRRGNRTKLIEALGTAEARATAYEYDKLDRLRETTRHNVTVVANDFTESTVTVTNRVNYDKRGNVIETIDAMGARTFAWYDRLGRKTHELSPIGTLSAWGYDGNGNVTSLKVYGDAVALPTAAGGTPPSPVTASNVRETTYSYDRADRLISTHVQVPTTAEWNGSSFVVVKSPVTITSGVKYDRSGNAVRQTDARGGVTWSWYDKLGRKTAQVDAENYLTRWTYDAEGNVLIEKRFTKKITGTVSETSDLDTLAGLASTPVSDRETRFTYDKNGRRLTEERMGVLVGTVSAAGVLTTATTTAKIVYTYNGLGQVLSKTEANSDLVSYEYDDAGRLVLETGAAFVDYTGLSVTPRTSYSYDGLNNLTRTAVQKGETFDSSTDRVTTYTYRDGGRLHYVTDAEYNVRWFGYDAAGRTVQESYRRLESDGTTSITESIVSRFDLAGRLTDQTNARYDGSEWVFADADGRTYDATRVRYNAWGDVTARGLTAGLVTPAGNAVEPVWQETYDYDAAGRLWRSNVGDGSLRFYAYDKAGNQTLTLSSAGANLSTLSASTYLDSITSTGDTGIADAVTTLTVYDKRGQATLTREPDRLLKTGGTTVTITRGRSYNAFGEVESETDARGYDASGNPLTFANGWGYTTTFAYNTMGRLIEKVMPQVNVTAANGTTGVANPSETYSYDKSGRLVAVTDANGYTTTRHLLAGTGHGADAEALVTATFNPDLTRAQQQFYDVFGDVRIVRNGTNQSTASALNTASDEQWAYDDLGRVTTIIRRYSAAGDALTDWYGYDSIGQRITHANSQFGAGVKERTDYDIRGRVVSSINYAGDETTTTWQWDASLQTVMGGTAVTVGGWVKTVSTIADRYSAYDAIYAAVEKQDYFGRIVDRQDMGGRDYNFAYDLASRLVSQEIRKAGSTVHTTNFSYFNTGQIKEMDEGEPILVDTTWRRTLTRYEYDADGRRVAEALTSNEGRYHAGGGFTDPVTGDYVPLPAYYVVTQSELRQGRVSYDALGRMVSYKDVDSTGAVKDVEKTWEYDKASNVRKMSARYRPLNADGTTGALPVAPNQVYWYQYDSLNRVITTKGTHNGTAIVRGATGADITYDAAGNRRTVANASGLVETYNYRADGQLMGVTINGATRASYLRDSLGQVLSYTEYDFAGTQVFHRYSLNYNLRGQLLTEKSRVKQGSDWAWNHTVNFYDATGIAAKPTFDWSRSTAGTSTGAMLYATMTKSWLSSNPYYDPAYPPGGTTNTTSEDNANRDSSSVYRYLWADGALQQSIGFEKGGESSTSTYYYNGAGRVYTVQIVGGDRPRTIDVTLDGAGLVIRREEESYAENDPSDLHYYFNGERMGDVSDNGTDNLDYAATITARIATPPSPPGPFRGGATSGTAYADFDQNYDAINGTSEDPTATRYTVAEGDTLQAIAQAIWGDSSLWYKLAEANGLTAASVLVAGQSLIVPNNVHTFHNTAETFRPYDPNEALGNTGPNMPKPKNNKCGVFGQILMIAIAVAVTALLTGPLSGAIGSFLAGGGTAAAGSAASIIGGIAGGAIAGATGSIASQAFGLATGIQTGGFNWKSVALAALGGAVGGGLGELGKAANAADGLTKAMTQVSKFSETLTDIGQFIGANNFLGGAMRGLISSAATQGVGVATGLQEDFDWVGVAAAGLGGGVSNAFEIKGASTTISNAVTGMAGGVANAAARSLIAGTDFGDNLLAALPDIIGNTIGNLMVDAATSSRGGPSGARSRDGNVKDKRALTPTEAADDYRVPLDTLLQAAGSDEERQQIIARRTAAVRNTIVVPANSGGDVGATALSFPMDAGGEYAFVDTGRDPLLANDLLTILAKGDGAEYLTKYQELFRGKDVTGVISRNFDNNPDAIRAFADLVQAQAVSTNTAYRQGTGDFLASIRATASTLNPTLTNGPAPQKPQQPSFGERLGNWFNGTQANGQPHPAMAARAQAELATARSGAQLGAALADFGREHIVDEAWDGARRVPADLEDGWNHLARGELGYFATTLPLTTGGAIELSLMNVAGRAPAVVSAFERTAPELASVETKVVARARVFTSADAHVGEAATQLERIFPGRVIGVNQELAANVAGGVREVDIVMDDFIIQVKSGAANGLVRQMRETAATLRGDTRRIIGYAPDDFSNHAWRGAAEMGLPIARSFDELVDIIRQVER